MRALVLSLLLTPSLAQAGVLVGDRLAVGIHPDGSLVDATGKVGITYDPVDAPMGGDMIVPGRKWEAFGLAWTREGASVEHTSVGPHIGGGIAFEWDEVGHNGAFTWQEGTADLDDVTVHVSVDLPVDGEVFWINVEVTARRAVGELQVYRTVDSDPDVFVNGSYATANSTGDGYALSASLRDHGKAMALGLAGGEGYLCSWCASVAAIRGGQPGPRDADIVIAVISEPTTLAADETLRLRFAYALATSAEDAVERIGAAMHTTDMDGDGAGDADCDDRDDLVYPGADELPDGVDNDCDGEVDEGTAARDDDGDGFNEWEGDCDDDDERVYPGADPVEGVSDADCDGLADDGTFREDEPPEGWGGEGSVLGEGEERESVSAACASPVGGAALLAWVLLVPMVRRRTGR